MAGGVPRSAAIGKEKLKKLLAKHNGVVSEVARQTGLGRNQVNHAINHHQIRVDLFRPPERSGGQYYETDDDEGVTMVHEGQEIRSPYDWMTASGLSLDDWRIRDVDGGSWGAIVKAGKDKNKKTTLYRVRVKLEPKVDPLKLLQEVEKRLSMKSYRKIKLKKVKQDGLVAEPSIYDAHIGLQTRNSVGGVQTLESGAKKYRSVVEESVQRMSLHGLKNYSKIIKVVGNDFLHIDRWVNKSTGATTAGTLMETGAHIYDIYSEGLAELIWEIDQYRDIAPVHIVAMPGNHDRLLAWTLCKCLQQRYHNDPNVTFNLSAEPQVFEKFGKVLIGYSHEGVRKVADYPGVFYRMTWDDPEYRDAKYLYWHIGHLHRQAIWEDQGVIIRRMPALVGTDAYHQGEGYYHMPAGVCVVWHPYDGEVAPYRIAA